MTFFPMQGRCPHCGRDDCMPELTTLNQKIADLEAQLAKQKKTFARMENAWRAELERWYAKADQHIQDRSLLGALNRRLAECQQKVRDWADSSENNYKAYRRERQQLAECQRERDALRDTIEWISVNDRLPNDAKDYQLFCDDTKEQMVGFHIGKGQFQFALSPYSGAIVCKPTHWMQLPSIPDPRTDNKENDGD